MAGSSVAAIQRLGSGCYEILDEDIAHGRVVIWADDPVRPRADDSFLIESGGRLYEAEVVQLVDVGRRWIATCCVEGPAL